MGEMRNTYKILVRKCEGKRHLGDLGVVGRTILKLILKKYNVRMWTGLF
jgi:hypothetical protein